jgi:hypothetical protein
MAQLERTSQSPKLAFVANVGPDPEETVVFVGTGVLAGKPVSAAVLETATAAAVACLGSIEAVRAISVSSGVHKEADRRNTRASSPIFSSRLYVRSWSLHVRVSTRHTLLPSRS